MTPFIDSQELISKYSTANLFILPSKSEGLGRVIIEAQSTACPVLISSDTGMTDLVIENETVLKIMFTKQAHLHYLSKYITVVL